MDFSLTFCLDDGTKLIEESVSNSRTPEFENNPAKPKSKTKLLLILGASAAILILATGILGMVLLLSKQRSPRNQLDIAADNSNKETNKPIDFKNSANTNDNMKSPTDNCSLSPVEIDEVKNISFEKAKFAPTSESLQILKNLAAHLKRLPDTCRVEIGVHSDNVGDETMNTKLTTARSLAIGKVLVEQGVSSDKLSYKGYGSSQPIASNTTNEGKKMNRRVEFKLFSKDKPNDTAADILNLRVQENLDKLKSDGVTIVTQNRNKPSKPDPLVLIVLVSANGDLLLNGEKMGNVSGKNSLSEKLKEAFKTREEMEVYKEGTKTVEKTVTIVTPPEISQAVLEQTLKIVNDAKASPVNLYVEK